jgi:hypothetical protein
MEMIDLADTQNNKVSDSPIVSPMNITGVQGPALHVGVISSLAVTSAKHQFDQSFENQVPCTTSLYNVCIGIGYW